MNEEFINIPNYPQIGDEEVQAMLYENRYYSIVFSIYMQKNRINYCYLFIDNDIKENHIFNFTIKHYTK